MRKLLLLLIGPLCFLPQVTQGQTGQASWSKLSGLQSGQAIQVATASKKYSGTFIRVSDAAVVVRDSSSEESIQRTDVRSVKVVKTNQRAKHTIIGAAIGGGSGAAFGAAVGGCSGSCWIGPDRGGLAVIFGGVGAVVGAVIGAVIPAHGQTIYKADAH